MLKPLDSRKLNALVSDGGDADCASIRRAREYLGEYRDLSLGLLCLLDAWDLFSTSKHNESKDWEQGNDKWHIYFRSSPFRTLRLKPGAEGTVNVYSQGMLLKSFDQFFDQPKQWQAMVNWIWKYGHQRQIARSIPQLNPQRLNALIQHGANDYGDDEELYQLMRNASHLLETKYMSKGAFELLMAFNFCRPQLSVDRSSDFLDDTGYESWEISFHDSLFHNLCVSSGAAEGVVEIYTPRKHPRSFQMTDGPPTWQAFLKHVWDYGNESHIDGKKPKAARLLSKTQAPTQSKQRHVEKPLLHRVLRQAGFKAQHETTAKPKSLKSIPEEEEEDSALSQAPPLQRRALKVMIANGPLGIKPRSKPKIDVQGQEDLETGVDAGGVDCADSHRYDSSSRLDTSRVP